MERWNELIAGHVLGNLTESEQQELSKVLSKNPQMMAEIARLRQTATLRSGQNKQQAVEPSPGYLPEGAEGWADMVAQMPNMTPEMMADILSNDQTGLHKPSTLLGSAPAAIDSHAVNSLPPNFRLDTHKPLAIAADTPTKPRPLGRIPFRTSPPDRHWGKQCTRWIVVLLIVGMGLDNWRLRRMLAIAQEHILELESTVEMVPIPTSLD